VLVYFSPLHVDVRIEASPVSFGSGLAHTRCRLRGYQDQLSHTWHQKCLQ
jgi:hypothetical protein